jgi:hypothetical protein
MATGEELGKIAENLKPAGYEVRVQNVSPDLGQTHYRERLILITHPPSTERTLWTLLHEYAHVIGGHDSDDYRQAPPHVLEHECEQWAFNRFKQNGLAYEDALSEAKTLLTQRIVRDIRRINTREQWEAAGIHRPAYEFVTTEQRIEIDGHFKAVIEALYKGSVVRPEKWYSGFHGPVIP